MQEVQHQFHGIRDNSDMVSAYHWMSKLLNQQKQLSKHSYSYTSRDFLTSRKHFK